MDGWGNTYPHPPYLNRVTFTHHVSGVSVMRDPLKVADKQIRNAQNGATAYVDGVRDVKEAPGQKAARKKDKYKANVLASVDKWADNTAAVSLQEWADAAAGKGGERF